MLPLFCYLKAFYTNSLLEMRASFLLLLSILLGANTLLAQSTAKVSKPVVLPDSSRPVELKVVGATMVGDTTNADLFTRRLSLRNKRLDTVIISDIRLTSFISYSPNESAIGNLRQDGQAVEKITIPPLGTVYMELSSMLPKAGKYVSNLTFACERKINDSLSRGSRLDTSFQAIRTLVREPERAPFYKIEPIGILTNVSGCQADLRVILRDTLGQGGTVNIPLILINQQRGDTSLQASFKEYTLWLEKEDSLLPLMGDKLVFAANEAKRLVVRFEQLEPAASYGGRVIVQGNNLRESSQVFNIRVRRSMLCATLLITAGLILAFLAKWLNETLSPKLKQRLSLLNLRTEYSKVPKKVQELDYREQATLSQLTGQIDDQLAAVALQALPDADLKSFVALMGDKLDLFYAAIALRVALEEADSTTQTTYSPTLNTAYSTLTSKTATDTDVSTQQKALSDAQAAIAQQMVATLQAECTKLITEVTEHEEFLAGTSAATLTEEAQRVKDMANIDPVGAMDAYDALRLKVARALCEGLKKDLSTPTNAFFTQAWPQIQAQTEAALNAGLKATASADDAFAAFHSAIKVYLGQLIQVVEAAYSAKGQGFPATLVSAKTALNAMDTTDYDQIYADIIASLPTGQQETMSYRGMDENTIKGLVFTAPLNQDTKPRFGTMEPRKLSPLMEVPDSAWSESSIRNTRLQLFLSEVLYSSIVLVVSVILGLEILYLDDDVWGTVGDMFAAFTWGFGIHAVSRNTSLGQSAFSFVSGKISTPSDPTAPSGGGAAGGQGAA